MARVDVLVSWNFKRAGKAVENVAVKVTQYFLRNRERPDRRWIRFEWIKRVIKNPLKREIQVDRRVRLWGRIEEAGGKALRVILLEDEETVHNAFFDNHFKEDEP